MKIISIKLLALVLACVFALSFVACDKETVQNDNPFPTEKQVYLCYTMIDYHEKCTRTYYYDEYGNELKTVKEDMRGNFLAEWISEYDDNQNLIKTSVVDTKNGEPFVQLIQSYDDKGNLIESRHFSTHDETVYTYQYDEQNRVMSRSSNGTLIETYTYEPDGSYKIQSVNIADIYSVYRADGKIELRQSGPFTKSVFIYNDEGFLVECINYYKEIMNRKTVYYLDENGNTIKVSQVNSQGIETVMGEYEYKLYTVKTK